MDYQQAKELHHLLFSFAGLFHEKFMLRIRNEYYAEKLPNLKKNHQKIMNLLYQKDQQTSTELGRKLDIEKGSLTLLIDQLVKWDLVTRTTDPDDRRKTLISLTAKGKEQMDKVMDFYARKLNDFFKDIEPQTMQEFIKNLRYVVNFLEKM